MAKAIHPESARGVNSADSPGQDFSDALAVALRYLSYRPRSVHEVSQRLAKRFAPDTVQRAVAYLLENRLLDDAEFALLWRKSRERRRPKGSRAIRSELRNLGVTATDIESALEDIDDPANAMRAALKPAARLAAQGCTAEVFRRKLSAHLLRRGFGYGTAFETVNQLWGELADSP